MGMNDYAREEKMQKIFDDRENIDEEEEDEVKADNKSREKDKSVINNHNDNNNSNHHEEKVRWVIIYLKGVRCFTPCVSSKFEQILKGC